MTRKTAQSLTTQAQVIRDETVKEANTRQRMYDMVKSLIDSLLHMDASGDLANLSTADKSTLVAAINELFSSQGKYTTTLDDAIAMTSEWAGFPAGTTVADLKALGTISKIIDLGAFPVVAAVVDDNSSVVLSENLPAVVEVGTPLQPILTSTFSRGRIQNGNGSQGPELVGLPNKHIFTGPGIVGSEEIESANLVEAFQIEAAVPAVFGNNIWSVQVDHDAGSGAYFDSHGNAANNLNAQRAAGSENDNSSAVPGRRYCFFGPGNPVDSAGVRTLAGKEYLNSDNETDPGDSIITTVEPGATNHNICVPAGKAIQIIDLDALNANLTANYVKSTWNVNDAGGNPVSYDIYKLTISGYSELHRHQVTVS